MSSVSNNNVIELFKKVYGQLHDLVPDDQPLSSDISWVEGNRVGSEFVEDVILGAEVGITLGGSGQDAFEINPAIAGAVKQTSVVPYVSILPSILPFATISRSMGSEQAFVNATKFITKNNLKSHNRFQEIMRFYGQAPELLGYVSYATATYRGVAFVAGTGTLNSIAFTNGINVASKAILLAPGQFAAGIWVGMQGVKVKQVDSNGVVQASGKLVSVNAKYGYITVDFVPVAASSTTSSRLAFDGMESSSEMIGIKKILSTNGTLFGINNSLYSLFRGNQSDLGQVKLTLDRLQEVIADAVNGGGLDGSVTVYVNPRSWKTLAVTEAGLRVYDKSYSPSKAENGFMDLEFYTQTGKLTIKAHRMVKEGDSFILKLDTWKRSGSAQVGFKVPGIEGAGDLIRPLENQAGYQFKSYADEYVFTPMPAHNIIVTGINDESAS
jgi:hypothetical protein